jgi:hypothetical protein
MVFRGTRYHMAGFWTLGILIIAGVFALLLFINPNLSWTVKRFSWPVYSQFLRRKRPKHPKTKEYGFHLSDKKGKAKSQEKEKPS